VTSDQLEIVRQALSKMTKRQLFGLYGQLKRGRISENLDQMSLTITELERRGARVSYELAELKRRGVRGMRINGEWVLS